MEIEILHWNGSKERELRVAFPIALDEARLSYEVPFGTVEIGKDELDFSLLPSKQDSAFSSEIYGGDHALQFREAINWIDASSPDSYSTGCLAASDSTLDPEECGVESRLLVHPGGEPSLPDGAVAACGRLAVALSRRHRLQL
jgi:hypothetical protein